MWTTHLLGLTSPPLPPLHTTLRVIAHSLLKSSDRAKRFPDTTGHARTRPDTTLDTTGHDRTQNRTFWTRQSMILSKTQRTLPDTHYMYRTLPDTTLPDTNTGHATGHATGHNRTCYRTWPDTTGHPGQPDTHGSDKQVPRSVSQGRSPDLRWGRSPLSLEAEASNKLGHTPIRAR